MKSVNQALNTFAKTNGYKAIEFLREKTLRGGGCYHKDRLVIKDENISIKQMLDEMYA